MGRDRAAYMREYRAKRRAAHAAYDAAKPIIGRIKSEASARIRELEEEVRHLKAELAKRPTIRDTIAETRSIKAGLADAARWDTQPVRAVPKKR